MRSRLITAAIAATVVLTACTPEQVAVIESHVGPLNADSRAALLALPDAPARLPDGRTVATDGKVSGVVAPAGSKCPEWYSIALEAGWPASDWERVDYIIHRESRCDPRAHNRSDPMSGSRGGAQINGFWCKPNRYESHPAGYLGAKGILSTCEDLFDPLTNLRAARAIYDYGVERGQCPWRPWTTRSTRWCG